MSTQASMATQVFELGSCCRPNAAFRSGTLWQIGLVAGSFTSTCTQHASRQRVKHAEGHCCQREKNLENKNIQQCFRSCCRTTHGIRQHRCSKHTHGHSRGDSPQLRRVSSAGSPEMTLSHPYTSLLCIMFPKKGPMQDQQKEGATCTLMAPEAAAPGSTQE